MELLNTKTTSCLILLFSIAFVQPAIAQEEEQAEEEGRLDVGGYGEFHYNDVVYNANGEATSGVFDFHRFVLAFKYDFNDWISFHSEVALEHTLVEAEEGMAIGGEIGLEQAYIDMQFEQEIGLRAGIMLVPVGIVNTQPEPVKFFSVERPGVEEVLIPSTWRESGIGVYGNTSSGFSYQAYLMAGIAPNGIHGANGIVEATQHGFKSSMANLAFTARLDYDFGPNLTAGISYFHSSLNSEIEEGESEEVPSLDGAIFNLVEAHLVYEKERFEARGLLVYSNISNVTAINNAFQHNAGESQFGGYVVLAYDLLPFFVSNTDQELQLFGRYGSFDTQHTTTAIPDNPEYHRTDHTFGLAYFPIEEVVFKADYQIFTSEGDKNIRQLNLGVAYEF